MMLLEREEDYISNNNNTAASLGSYRRWIKVNKEIHVHASDLFLNPSQKYLLWEQQDFWCGYLAFKIKAEIRKWYKQSTDSMKLS